MSKDIYFFMQIIRKIKKDDISSLASQVAYNLLLSFMPFLIFLLTIIGFTPIKSSEVLPYIRTLMPSEAYALIKKVIIEIVDTKHSSLLSFSLILTVWSCTGGVKAIIRALNKAYEENESRGFFKLQFLSIMFTLGIVLAIFIMIVMLVFGNTIGLGIENAFNTPLIYNSIWNVLRYVVAIPMLGIISAAIYHFMPCRRLTWREVLPGTAFSTAGWIISALFFSFYVDNYANYSRLYGSIAAVFILTAWIYLEAIILLIGGEINAILTTSSKYSL